MKHMTIYIDLDRTLLDTGTFTQQLWKQLAAQNDALDPQAELARAKDFFDYRGDMYAYDFFEHARHALQCDEAGLQEILGEFCKNIRQETVVYPDSEAALRALASAGDRHILTYGKTDYQRFKLQCVALFDAMPATIVEQPKGKFFDALGTSEPCILIDDKPIAAELPPFVNFIHLDRAQQSEVQQHDGFASVRNLDVSIKEVYNIIQIYNTTKR